MDLKNIEKSHLYLIISLISIIFLISLNSVHTLYLSLCVGIISILYMLYFKQKNEIVIYLLLLYIFSIFVYKKNQERFKNKENIKKQIEELEKQKEHFYDLNSKGKKSKKSRKSTKPKPKEKIDTNRIVKIKKKDQREINFVLKGLLDNYDEINIDELLTQTNIKNIYEIEDKLLNQKQTYNNLFEKIICKQKDGSSIDYINCMKNQNYKNLAAFSELIKVYTFSPKLVLHLINNEKIYSLCALVDKKAEIFKRIRENTSLIYDYEVKGLNVYLNRKTINDKYFRILEILELDKELDNNDIESPLKDRLYHYNNFNKQLVNHLNSIAICFDYYKIFDNIRLEYTEDDFISDYSLLRSIDLNKNYWEKNDYFKQYKIKEKIINKINSLTKDDKNIFRHEKKETPKPKKEKRDNYKLINKKKDIQSDNLLEKLNLENIKENFVGSMTGIIDDFIILYNNRCKSNCGDTNNPATIFLYYFNGIIELILKEKRMFYVGIFILIISFVLYFIEITK